MAGKAYSMREMKAIVEYLTERKAYGEIKGRKMWMEYANSEKTIRTWQSLKETFLKRILPDIQNPYYKLTMDQVRSFRQGYDVAEREKSNRLEFRTASEESNGDSKNATESNTRNDKEQPTTSNDHDHPTRSIEPTTTNIDEELEKATGEGITSAKIPSRSRSSADTVVLEYENADELQRVLESPKNDDNEGKSKSFKDLLTFEYSAPMTPLVRNLLEDFETESEASDKEPQLNIDENPQEAMKNTELEPMVTENRQSGNHNKNKDVESPIEIIETEDSANVTVNSKDVNTTVVKEIQPKDLQEKSVEPQQKKSLQLKKPEKNKKDDMESTHEPGKDTSMQDNDITNADSNNITEFVPAESNAKTFVKSPDAGGLKKDCNNTIANANSENSLQNTGNTSSDTILPNNQEALDGSKKAVEKTNLDKTGEDLEKVNKTNGLSKTENYLEKENDDEKGPGKRLTSQDGKENKKQKLSDNQSEKSREDVIFIPIIEIHDSPGEHDTTSMLVKNTGVPDTKVIKINTDTPTSTEKQCDDHLKTLPESTDKPCTKSEKEKKDVSVTANMDESKNIEVVEDKNPCLLSVSLFDEQFKNTKYSDSDDEVTPAPKQNLNKITPQADVNGKKQREDKTENEVGTKKNTAVKIVEKIQKNDGILESSADCEQQKHAMVNKTVNVDNKVINLQREKALASVFGFAQGIGAASSRKRHLSHRRRSYHYRRRHSKNDHSNSSEWTSESDSESYVSPPRGRRNRHTRKYLKPKSSRILQDPEEGMLYVIFGKNIYPLVKDGTHIKNFLTYRPDSGSDMEEESYWRKKYVDEKKRVEEVKKLLKESQERKAPQMNAPTSPILPSPSRNTTTHSQQKCVQNANSKALADTPIVDNKIESKDGKMVLKIAAKDGLEYCLEGGWNQISNAMPQMVRMLQSETTAPNNRKSESPHSKTVERQPSKGDVTIDGSSGLSTPVIQPSVDPEVHEKVNRLEKEIFKEIEDLEMESQLKQNETERNVTKRKPGRPRKESSSSSRSVTQSPAKKRTKATKTNSTESKLVSTKPTRNKRTSKQTLDIPEQIEAKQEETEKPTTLAKTKIKEEHNITEQRTETTKQKESDPIRTSVTEKEDNLDRFGKRRASLRISKQKDNGSVGGSEVSLAETRSSARLVKTPKKYDTDSSASEIKLRSRNSTSKEKAALLGFDDEDARFMFPPTSPINDKKTPKGKKNRSFPKIIVVPPQENTSGNSVDSTQGYQDSDDSPIKFCFPRRKKRASLSTQKKYRSRCLNRRKSHPTFLQELFSDSNNSSYFVPLRRSQSTLNSEVYRTESFQLLLPKEKRSFNKLDRIDETGPSQIDPSTRHFNSVSQNSNISHHENSNIVVEIVSSSNVSLPLSPELSVVENLSISRDMIKSETHPTINEMQLNGNNCVMDFSEYMISNIDVSVPLMNQKCELQKSTETLTPKKKTRSTPLSQPLFGKECIVRIEDLTLSETLDQRLRDLLLESGKKTTVANNNKENAMEVDQTKTTTTKKIRTRIHNTNAMEVDESKITTKTRPRCLKEIAMEVETATAKKTRPKKRSSTPQKKKTAQKKKSPKTPIIEEHMESCSYAGRKSCPPVMTQLPNDEDANDCLNNTHNTVKTKVKTKKKKDIIKVKINRPKTRSTEKLRDPVENVSVTSTYTDSGINETISGVFLKDCEEIVDLIHNHSETCLLANECLGDSVQFVDNSNSIISLSSSEQSVLGELQKILDDAASLSGELFTINSRDNTTTEPRTSEEIYKSPETVYNTPAATNSSLITEDLSDDPPTHPTQWYLVSEDDNTQQASSSMASYGANLMQIFPITYAVPDLSTISEISKENEDSRKPSFDTDGDTGDCNLHKLF